MKILFPTEFSEPALNAFRYALIMTDRWEATIELFHVVYPQVGALDLPILTTQATQEMVEVARELLHVFKQKALDEVEDQLNHPVSILTEVEVGIPESSISRIVERDDIDLIIMGSRGKNRSGIDKWMGSVAAGVVQKAPCPVIVIPENAAFESSLNVAYATDISIGDPFEVWQSLKILENFNPTLHLVHVNDKEEGDQEAWDKMKEMKDFLRSKDFTANINIHHIFGQDVEKSLNNFIETQHINFLIMYQPHRGFWNRLFHKSKTKQMALHTKIPLMVQKD